MHTGISARGLKIPTVLPTEAGSTLVTQLRKAVMSRWARKERAE